jgi:hypothetical protein
MAAYASIASASELNGGGADTLVVTAPTGIQAGNLLLAFIGISQNAATGAISGWTQLATASDSSNKGLVILWKIADSGDAGAANFTINYTAGSGDPINAAIMRVTGTFTGAANLQSSLEVKTAAATNHTFTPGLTPTSTSDLLIMGCHVQGANTVGGYTTANGSPSFTERAELTQAATGDDAGLGIATAAAPIASATGDFSVTLGSSFEAIGFLVVVADTANGTATAGVATMTATALPITATGGANVSMGVAVMTATALPISASTAPGTWVDDTRTPTTWVNESQS